MEKKAFWASATARLFVAAMITVVGNLLVSCNENSNVNEGMSMTLSFEDKDPYYGERVINDSIKRDSVITPDKKVEKIDLKFWVKAREHREVFVDNFNTPSAAETFTAGEKKVVNSRREGNWLVYEITSSVRKDMSLGGSTQTVDYTTYEEVATYVPDSHEFKSTGWTVVNKSDDFKGAVSSKDGYSEEDYKNEIKATYLTKTFELSETIAFFAKGEVPTIDHYEAVGERKDYPAYTTVTLEKIAVYTDGNRETVGKYTTNLPISVKPLTNWVINAKALGEYVADAFTGTENSKKALKADEFFFYNEYAYNYSNKVAGQTNAVAVTVPNDIVFKDGDVEYKYDNTALDVKKGAEAVNFANEDDTKKSYAYTCDANVVFGSSQSVTLPGTINIAKATVEKYLIVNAKRVDYPTYTFVTLDKVAYYSDGTEKKVGTYSAKLPISVNPLTNWVINTDVFGVYTSNNFSGNQQGRTAKTAEKFFSYNEYSYRYSNTVSSETNALAVNVPNDIVFKDGDVEYKFANSNLAVSKGEEKTTASNVSASKSTYDYICVANVSFGEASTSVTLPGTINIDTREHAHGKVVATYFTSTPNENRSYYKSVAVIQFADGYRTVGMAENDGVKFEFNMGSNNAVNSAVYANNTWIPAIAEDNQSAGCMVWRDEYGTPKRTLDFITATRDRWNNGHNTVWDVRRDAKISSDGYSVDLYLNGIKYQTLDF